MITSGDMTGDLQKIARQLVAPGKGILAIDESGPTIEKRFKALKIPSTPETRADYRHLLFSTPQLSQFISGVILYDETLRQKNEQGPFPELISRAGILVGIKVDKGTASLPKFPGEKITEGLDGLGERLAEYRKLGARFTKWRAVIVIAENCPSRFCLEANAHALARFAALSQENGLLPIVEPEVLMDGDHSIERCYEVTRDTLRLLFASLHEHRVALGELLLKASMVISGSAASKKAPIEAVAGMTLSCLRETVPPSVPGIVFLSGGQSEAEATAHLNRMVQLNKGPWELSFSFGRALQAPALKAWAGRSENIAAAQKALHHRARLNSLARFGNYSSEMEQ